ncbi:hypothetical protein F5Y00DRAFT_264829 [Daldinia vernicosa]|uniref:uncharacterized protein n=1 Tax=Daldinia vernicosa TaxID=114800 RepID=UPI00200857FB|nr:uncharacterized protein F5Y00DRAFT_264829 [Daldinia vernicosa]KAI0846112.1 hypothetical protein F5Y00DRAFT_264829 [Daldinia vernicosa]
MSKTASKQTGNKASGELPSEAPDGQVYDSSYTTEGRKDSDAIPVLKDDENIEDPIDPEDADSDKQLARDEAEAIDQKNVLNDRTRKEKPRGSYTEPTDEEMGLTEEA